ncbi:hypothetical protein GL177_17750 [Vibrio toranzoniae]|uniref:hypothetical protein n=1 Tax=Vibrio TaxID=662 RepID=UPI0013774A24|nr:MULTISPECIES: hypothetical protein [Vibrio]MDA0143719.1 hypothetical protein [Vibrio sp. RW]NAZ55168.1 hypothetical protein [Vibrio toranzoniae]NAZ92269.1 hypothetical protein [Vibrio toranzoniae]
MKPKTPIRYKRLVDTFLKDCNKGNQPRIKRKNEVQRAAEKVESLHGKIPRLGMILRKLPDNLYHSYEPKRNSFGYKETTQKLQETINEVMGRNMF